MVVVVARGHDWAPYSSALAAHWLDESPDELHRRLTGTLVSADLSGFTAMSEQLAALGREGSERLTDIVNGCFESLIDVAAREGGDVLKFGGDALLIWFEGEDSAKPAARAMARMQQAIARRRFAKLGLRMSVGGHFGEFDMFLVGEPDWRELVLLGAPVTRVVDLEAAAEAGEILISAELARRLPEDWHGRIRNGRAALTIEELPRSRTSAPDRTHKTQAALISPSLRDEIPVLEPLGGEHRLAAVAFIEVLGTDESLARVGAQSFAVGVDALVRAAQRLQRTYGVQFLYTDVISNGIKLIATAGAPRATVNDDEAALRYAVALVNNDPLRRLKAGVNRGRVFGGFLGSPRRRTYTLMGDSVNLAARLMAKAEPGQVVAGAGVLDHVSAEMATDELAPFLVKGKTEPIAASVVHEVGADLDVDDVHVRLPLVGREAEMARLSAMVAETARGHGRAVRISGPAGIGKSRLIKEIASDERVARHTSVQCQPYLSTTPYAVAKVVLRDLLGIKHGADPVEAGRSLHRVVSQVRPGLLPLLPLLAVPVAATVEPTAEASAIADEFVMARTHDAVLELLASVATALTMIVLEDTYYADDASAVLFRDLTKAVGRRPWLLVEALRTGTTGILDSEAIDQVELEPLGPLAVAVLASSALGMPGDHLTMAATERAGGNPFFVLQLMDAVRAGVAADDVPESVERVVAERFDRLAPADRTTLRYAAVLGPRFDADLLAIVLRGAGQAVPDARTWKRLADIVEVDSRRDGRFRHLLYRDVAYEGLPYRPRARLHQQVGELLEASSYAQDYALLAEHFFRAGDHERTWRYSVAAGDRAWQQMAVVEADVAYGRALRTRRHVAGLSRGECARVAETHGDVLERVGRYADAERSYRLAEGLHESDAQARIRLMRKRGVLREREGRYAAAMRWYGRARARVVAGDLSALEPELLVATAGVLDRLGRKREQLKIAKAAADLALAAGDVETEAHASLVAQAALTDLGRFDDLDYGQRALDLFTTTGNTLYLGKVHNNLGVAHYFRGRWTESASHYRLSAQQCEAAGDVVETAVARNNLGEVLADQGRTDDAVTEFTSANLAFERAGHRLGCAVVRSNLARARSRGGDAADVMDELRSIAEEFRALNVTVHRTETLLRLAEACLLAQKTVEASLVIAEVEPFVQAKDCFPGSDSALLRLRSWMARLDGQIVEAIQAAESAAQIANQSGSRFERLLALQQIAALRDDQTVLRMVESECADLGVVRLPALPVS